MSQPQLTNALDFLGQEVTVVIDRPLASRHPTHGFLYLLNYGYIPNTLAPDGEAVDAYVLGVFAPCITFHGACIAVIQRTDDADDKVVVAPPGAFYSSEQIRALTEFQERFFQSVIHCA